MSGFVITRVVTYIYAMSALVSFGVAIKGKSHLSKCDSKLYLCEGANDEPPFIRMCGHGYACMRGARNGRGLDLLS